MAETTYPNEARISFNENYYASGRRQSYGEFEPETWDSKPESSFSSTIITLPDGSSIDLGHFDTAGKLNLHTKRREAYLEKRDVANGVFYYSA